MLRKGTIVLGSMAKSAVFVEPRKIGELKEKIVV
jgi:hypothetical protein